MATPSIHQPSQRRLTDSDDPGPNDDPEQLRLFHRWRAARSPSSVVHLDSAGAARPSRATIAAETAYLESESELGAYAAEVEAGSGLHATRARLVSLMGPGLDADDLSFHHSASAAFATLLMAWRLPAGARIGVVPSEYGSNMLVLAARALRTAVSLVDLPVDETGVIDVETLDRAGVACADAPGRIGLADLDLVVFPQVPSQRGIVQPAAAIGARCAAEGVPLVLDVAQSLGQVEVSQTAASAYIGTSRKWLCGPRGAGFLAVRKGSVDLLDIAVPSLHSTRFDRNDRPVPLPGLARLGIGEAATVSRIGLGQAVTELMDSGPSRVFARIARLAGQGRHLLDGAGGWRVREDPDSPCGIITMQPPPGTDPVAVRDRLYREDRVLASAIPVDRSRDLTGPVLRASAHVYTDPAEFERLAMGLERIAYDR
ncbi:aminotransferase class V-fold PLP-dependent enzyme [Frankia sp. CcWB3]